MTKEKELNLEDARKLLQEDEEQRQKECMEELKKILEKHGYSLQVTQPNIVLNKVNK